MGRSPCDRYVALHPQYKLVYEDAPPDLQDQCALALDEERRAARRKLTSANIAQTRKPKAATSGVSMPRLRLVGVLGSDGRVHRVGASETANAFTREVSSNMQLAQTAFRKRMAAADQDAARFVREQSEKLRRHMQEQDEPQDDEDAETQAREEGEEDPGWGEDEVDAEEASTEGFFDKWKSKKAAASSANKPKDELSLSSLNPWITKELTPGVRIRIRKGKAKVDIKNTSKKGTTRFEVTVKSAGLRQVGTVQRDPDTGSLSVMTALALAKGGASVLAKRKQDRALDLKPGQSMTVGRLGEGPATEGVSLSPDLVVDSDGKVTYLK